MGYMDLGLLELAKFFIHLRPTPSAPFHHLNDIQETLKLFANYTAVIAKVGICDFNSFADINKMKTLLILIISLPPVLSTGDFYTGVFDVNFRAVVSHAPVS